METRFVSGAECFQVKFNNLCSVKPSTAGGDSFIVFPVYLFMFRLLFSNWNRSIILITVINLTGSTSTIAID